MVQFGVPQVFWRRTRFWPHPFRKHALLSRHGRELSNCAKARAIERCREKKGVWRIPLLFDFQIQYFLGWITFREMKHYLPLIALAKRATSMIWGINEEQLDASITRAVAFGRLRTPTTLRAILMRSGAAGYGGVVRQDDRFKVVAKGRVWPILSHELVKGTVELICLHGLHELEGATYRHVLHVADRPEFEPWLLQAGCELWRRLLTVLPVDRPVAQIVMHLARLEPRELEEVMLAVVESPEKARQYFAKLNADDATA